MKEMGPRPSPPNPSTAPPRLSNQSRTESDSAKSPARSVHQCTSSKPAAASSDSTRSRRNFALISVRISSPSANVDVEVEVVHDDVLRAP